ncbi:transcription elongation factor GreA [Patescibacteria group bacterium]|nr:transcription elongation factor GreA [Patescibacteria group bacterium]
MSDKIILTPEGLRKLEKELGERKEKRKEIIEKIELAKEHGDLSENAEYHEARAEQSFNEGRILDMENILKNAEAAKQSGGRGAQIGSKVITEVDGQQKEFMIAGSNESNPSEGLISCDSPLGESLLSKEIGEVVEVKTPKGVIAYKVVDIK